MSVFGDIFKFLSTDINILGFHITFFQLIIFDCLSCGVGYLIGNFFKR